MVPLMKCKYLFCRGRWTNNSERAREWFGLRENSAVILDIHMVYALSQNNFDYCAEQLYNPTFWNSDLLQFQSHLNAQHENVAFFLLFLVSKNLCTQFQKYMRTLWIQEWENIRLSHKIKLTYICPTEFLGSIMNGNLKDTSMQGSEVEWT